MGGRAWNRDRPHAVYRHYADSGVLLYVGRSADPDKRWGTLRQAQPAWTQYSVRRDDEWYPHMDPAAEAEECAIQTEEPLFNHQCVPSTGRRVNDRRLRTLHLADGAAVQFCSTGETWYEIKLSADVREPGVSGTVTRWDETNYWMMGGGM